MLRDAAGRDHVMLWTGAAAPGFVVTLQPGGAALSFVILRVRDRNLTFRDDSTPTGMIMPDRMEASGSVGQAVGRRAQRQALWSRCNPEAQRLASVYCGSGTAA